MTVNYGWISPDGNLHHCARMEHGNYAMTNIISDADLCHYHITGPYAATEHLLSRGWVRYSGSDFEHTYVGDDIPVSVIMAIARLKKLQGGNVRA